VKPCLVLSYCFFGGDRIGIWAVKLEPVVVIRKKSDGNKLWGCGWKLTIGC